MVHDTAHGAERVVQCLDTQQSALLGLLPHALEHNGEVRGYNVLQRLPGFLCHRLHMRLGEELKVLAADGSHRGRVPLPERFVVQIALDSVKGTLEHLLASCRGHCGSLLQVLLHALNGLPLVRHACITHPNYRT